MDIGRLNKRIVFLKQGTKEDEMGQEIPAWIIHKEVWATVKPLRGREYWDAQKIRPELTYKVTTRYHKEITPDMRIAYKDKIMEIKHIINTEEADNMLEMQCTEHIENYTKAKEDNIE